LRTVRGEVDGQLKGVKAFTLKFKKRKGYKRLKGHRQNLTKVRITDVAASAAKPKAAKAPAKKKAAAEPVVEVVADAPAAEQE